MLTLILTVFQLYRDYQADIDQVEISFKQIESVHLTSITEHLWITDIDGLGTIVNGLANMRDINYIAIFEDGNISIEHGEKPTMSDGFRSYPLVIKKQGILIEMGLLEIGFDINAIQQRLYDRTFVILAGNFIKTALVVMFMMLIFYRVVSRHLTFISHYLVGLEIGDSNQLLKLDRTALSLNKKDELDLVADSINQYLTEIDKHLTERKKTEDLLKKSNDEYNHLNQELDQRVEIRTRELEVAVRELEAFTYSISHDLRSPLRSLDGFSQAILEDHSDKLDETGRDYLNRIRKASVRMGDLIDDLLHLSQVSKSDVKVGPVNLSQLVTGISEDIKRAGDSRNFEFVIANELEVDGDSRLLKVALENLLGNAAKYSTPREVSRIEFGEAPTKDGRRVFYIRDNGVGFDMRYADKLFVSFQRLHHAKDFPGNGIGLSIVERVIKKHGGAVWADSVLNEGATFYFQL